LVSPSVRIALAMLSYLLVRHHGAPAF